MPDPSEAEAEKDALLQLPAILDLKAAAPLAAAFLARRGSDVVIGGGDVQRLGGQCLQVLLSASASWREDGQSMILDAPSAEFLSALDLFGAGAALLFDREDPLA